MFYCSPLIIYEHVSSKFNFSESSSSVAHGFCQKFFKTSAILDVAAVTDLVHTFGYVDFVENRCYMRLHGKTAVITAGAQITDNSTHIPHAVTGISIFTHRSGAIL